MENTIDILVNLLVGLVIGTIAGWVGYRIYQNSIKKRAQQEAQELLDEAKEASNLALLDEKEKIQELEAELWARHEPEFLKSEEKIEDLQAQADEKKKKSESILQSEKQKYLNRETEIKSQEKVILDQESKFNKKKADKENLNKEYILSLSQKTNKTPEQLKEEIINELIQEENLRARNFIENTEENTKTHAEQIAKRYLDIALDRFIRPFCSERGIGSVSFPDEHVQKLFCDPAGNNIKAIQEYCGCDIIIEDHMDYIGVAGFDPVRRELTRRTLERLMKERNQINPQKIKSIAEQCKKELFRSIKNDGDQLAKELKLEGLHPEIRQMMGSLRYRYSFTQNQHFHCGEVGWLCGLLSSELNLDIKKGRRAGMLHDLGKSMDHALDGGHAVIGADFIEKRNEAPDIVHAVRAHHYDEQPSTDLAFLVIASDAISGARPGARRSTIESYTQKVTELEAIARSFDGVTDVFILSGGRECRVVVNGKVINDLKAIELSKQIATRIEAECNYPGQIKVVIVRSTHVVEQTRSYQERVQN